MNFKKNNLQYRVFKGQKIPLKILLSGNHLCLPTNQRRQYEQKDIVIFS